MYISLVNSFKDVAIGVILLIVVAAFVAVAIADNNITGLGKVVLGFVVALFGVAILFAIFRAVK